ncbi:hypothetical protein ACWCQW_39095 [Streptomyces mirabilis]
MRGEFAGPASHFKSQFLTRASTAQMRAGDADAGCATAHDVLTLAEGIQSARLDDHLRTMLTEARSYSASSPARDLLDRGESIMRQRAAA